MSDRRTTAIHEAGHAVVGRVLSLVCGAASIEANDDEAGHSITADPWVTCQAWDDRGIYRGDMMASILKARILTYMAGREAEEEFLGDCSGGDDDDLYQIAMMMDSLGVPQQQYDRNERRLRLIARGLIRRHRAIILRIADELLAHTVVSGERLDELVGRPLPPTLPRPVMD